MLGPTGHSFRITLGIASGAVLTGLLLGIVRVFQNDSRRLARAAHERALRTALREVESLAAWGDVTGFFAAGRGVLQVRLAALWQRPAQAITLADVTSLMPSDSPVIEFFQEADQQEYSPMADPSKDRLPVWRALLEKAMTSLPTALPQ